MQCWDQVQYKEGTPNEGKAGVVVRVNGDEITVKLDEGGEVAADRADLRKL